MGGDIGPTLCKKSLGYSTGYFSDFGIFLKMLITQKIRSESAQTFYIP